MLTNVLAVIIGIIAGLAAYMGAFILLAGLSGTPAMGVEDFFAFIGGQFPADVIFLLFAMGGFVVVPLASFCGARVAARLGSSRPMLLAMIVGSALTGVVLRGLTFVHGDFTWPVLLHLGLVAFPVLLNLGGAWVAGRMEQKRRAAGDTSAPAPAEAGKAESDET
jgi:hypothetical protein